MSTDQPAKDNHWVTSDVPSCELMLTRTPAFLRLPSLPHLFSCSRPSFSVYIHYLCAWSCLLFLSKNWVAVTFSLCIIAPILLSLLHEQMNNSISYLSISRCTHTFIHHSLPLSFSSPSLPSSFLLLMVMSFWKGLPVIQASLDKTPLLNSHSLFNALQVLSFSFLNCSY